jgi:hypothetical protein
MPFRSYTGFILYPHETLETQNICLDFPPKNKYADEEM